MIEYKKETKEVDIPYKIICDICKKEYNADNWIELQEFTHIREVCGYGSLFGDGMKIYVDICQHCLYKFLKGEES